MDLFRFHPHAVSRAAASLHEADECSRLVGGHPGGVAYEGPNLGVVALLTCAGGTQWGRREWSSSGGCLGGAPPVQGGIHQSRLRRKSGPTRADSKLARWQWLASRCLQRHLHLQRLDRHRLTSAAVDSSRSHDYASCCARLPLAAGRIGRTAESLPRFPEEQVCG